MNKKKLILYVVIAVVVIAFLIGGYFFFFRNSSLIHGKANDTSLIDDEVDLDNGEEKVDWDSLNTEELNLSGKSVSITSGGVYTLTGSITSGNITVNTDEDVKLIFNGISISSNDGPAVLIEAANNTVIELKEGTVNTLSDGSVYSNADYNGCIHSKDDLVFQGSGTLKITGNYKDGIVSKDDLKFSNGTYIINSVDDGIVGKDSIYVVDGDFTINCESDGLKSSNAEDTTKGYINIDGGKFVINSGQDGMQAETKLIINDGDITITTSEGSGSSSSAIYKDFYGGSTYDSTSSKGLKAIDNLVIKNGNIIINSKDDAIHSNNYVGIVDGNITISSGDDGIHADTEVIIDGGVINISQSYEGVEAENITINGGDISVVASDDGINVSGGNDQSSMGGRTGQNPTSSSGGTLYITGGKVYVNATGDGLDANGNIIVSGGEVYVDGPTNDGNGPLDYDTTFDITGGKFIAVGSSGMAQGVSSSSTQYSLMFYLSNSYSGKISIVSSSGTEIFSYSPAKSYKSVIVSSSAIVKGEKYTLKIDGKEISSLVSSSVNASNGSSYGGGSDPGQGGGRRPGGH